MIQFDAGCDLDIAPCNKTCASCNHFAPWGNIPMMRPEEVEHDLHILRQFAHSPNICILGGEPTLNPWVVDIARVARGSGFADKIRIITNGTRLHLMTEEFWRSFDRIEISIYPDMDEQTQRNIELMEFKHLKYGFEKYLSVSAFSSVLSARELTPLEAINNYNACPLRHPCHNLYHGWLYQCPAARTIAPRFRGMGEHEDGIAVDETLTEKKLEAYLNRREPLQSCYRCSQRKHFHPWQEAATLDEWLQESTEHD